MKVGRFSRTKDADRLVAKTFEYVPSIRTGLQRVYVMMANVQWPMANGVTFSKKILIYL